MTHPHLLSDLSGITGSDEVDKYCQKATNIGLSIICLPNNVVRIE